jgi:hypothetical protein
MRLRGHGVEVSWQLGRGGGGGVAPAAAEGRRVRRRRNGEGSETDGKCFDTSTTQTRGFGPITNHKLRPVCNMLRPLHIDFTPNCFAL